MQNGRRHKLPGKNTVFMFSQLNVNNVIVKKLVWDMSIVEQIFVGKFFDWNE